MTEKYNHAAFTKRFLGEIDRRPVPDKDAAEETLRELPGVLKQVGLNHRTRIAIFDAYSSGVRDGNPEKTQGTIATMGELIPVRRLIRK